MCPKTFPIAGESALTCRKPRGKSVHNCPIPNVRCISYQESAVFEYKMSWSVSSDIPGEDTAGILGFSLYGKNGLLEDVPPYFEGGSGEIYTKEKIERIRFHNFEKVDGIYLDINVTKNGEKLDYECVNCLESSTSFDLGRLYLDTDMNGKINQSNTAHCQASCEFKYTNIK
jgi:hypothetical protein